MKYKSGDIVIKKSGGNKMTVERFDDNLYKCVWFVGTKFNFGFFEEKDLLSVVEYKRYLTIEKRDDTINRILK